MRVIPLAAYFDRVPCGAGSATAAALPQATREDEIEGARRQGESQGRETARREYEADLQKEREHFEARLSEARRIWVDEEGKELSRSINDGFTRIEDAIADVVARLLEPLILADARKATLAGLKETLGEIMTKSDCATMRIQGPDDLLAVLRESLGQLNTIVWSPGAGRDVQVEIDNTIIQTRLEPWAAHLREAMG